MTMLGRMMMLITVFGLIVFCILLYADLTQNNLAWWQVGLPLFLIGAMWIIREVLLWAIDAALRRNTKKARRKDGRVNG